MPVEVDVVEPVDRQIAVHGHVFFKHEISTVVVVGEVLCVLDEDLALVDEVYRQRDRERYRHDEHRRHDGDDYAFFLLDRGLFEFWLERLVHFFRVGDGRALVYHGSIVVLVCRFFFFHIFFLTGRFFFVVCFVFVGRIEIFSFFGRGSFRRRFVYEIGRFVKRDIVCKQRFLLLAVGS